jgi:uncharacterized protein involved in type VI secretion and phage assembly
MIGLDWLRAPEQNDRFYGVTIGVVTNNQDEDGLGRIKVKFPWLSETDESAWARVLTFMAGKDQGGYFLPEVGDEVLVAFEHGKMEFPYVLGSLWNQHDPPPESNKEEGNNRRVIKSRSGHVVILDDTNDQEQIIIRDKGKKNEIVFDAKKESITVKAGKELTIEIEGNLKITSTKGDVAIECNNFSVNAKEKIDLNASSNCSVEATAGMALKCMKGIQLNDGALEVT